MYSTMHLILALTFQFITIYFDFQEIKVKEAHSGHLGSILQGGFGQFFSVDIGTWSPFVFYMYGDSSIVIQNSTSEGRVSLVASKLFIARLCQRMARHQSPLACLQN